MRRLLVKAKNVQVTIASVPFAIKNLDNSINYPDPKVTSVRSTR